MRQIINRPLTGIHELFIYNSAYWKYRPKCLKSRPAAYSLKSGFRKRAHPALGSLILTTFQPFYGNSDAQNIRIHYDIFASNVT